VRFAGEGIANLNHSFILVAHRLRSSLSWRIGRYT
jgi:hypothetical protein